MEKILKENFSVFGRTTLRKFGKLRIYIEGLAKIGADLTTNLVILSPQLITLHDTEPIRADDAANTFHYQREHVGKKTRADYLIEVCHRLNNKVYVDKVNTELNEEALLKYDVAIFCDIYDLGRVMSANRFIRSQKHAHTVVMFACQMGFFGLVVTDFGEQWDMFSSGIDFPKVPIKNISTEQKGTVVTLFPHNYRTGDFVVIKGVDGMKHINGDARPVTVVNESTFLIEDTSSFGTYVKGGVCEKVDLVERLSFQSFQQQLVNNKQQLILIAKSIVSFYQNNSKLPGLFDEQNEEETMQNLVILADKAGMKFDERKARDMIRTSSYCFYPLVHMFAAIVSLEVVKCTGKYRPVKSPFMVDWYGKIGFESKKKVEGTIVNIIDTHTLQKLSQLQVGIVDDGHQSLQLLNLLYSCSIAQKNRVILFGLQSINESKQVDGLALKAHIKFQVANELFKNKKTETIPCSLSFSNDLILSDMWNKIRVLINASDTLNDYVFSNVIWNQISIIDSQSCELKGLLKVCAAGKSQLKQRKTQGNNLPDNISNSFSKQCLLDYRSCVHHALDEFRLLFIDIFEDVRCFFNIGGSYVDKVKMEVTRRNIFLLIICCLEDGAYLQPENIVKVCRFAFEELHPKTPLDRKDPLIMDYLRSFYQLISWFYTKKEIKTEDINAHFAEHLTKTIDQSSLTQREKYDIAYSKVQMRPSLTIPYMSLNDLYRREHTVKFIWYGSQLHAKAFGLDEDFSSKKFYKHYFRKLKPSPFIVQIINSIIPVAIIECVNGNLKNAEVNMIEGKIQSVDCPPPVPFKPKPGVTLVPANCNQWTIIVIEGPKKIAQIIQRFNYMDGVIVTKIRCHNHDLYDRNAKKHLYIDLNPETIPALNGNKNIDKSVFELYVEAQDRQGKICYVSRVKYILV